MYNLKVTVDDKQVTLFADTSIPMRLLSPIFNSEADHSLEFSVPRVGNEHIFDYAHRVTRLQKAERDHYILVSFDCYSFEGTCAVTDASDDEYTLFIKTGLATVVKTLNERKLTDLTSFDTVYLGTDQRSTLEALAEIVQGTTDEGFDLPAFVNEGIYKEENADFGGIVNRYDSSGGGVTGNKIVQTGAVNINTVAPCFRLGFVLRKMFEDVQLIVDTDFETDTLLSKIVMFSQRLLDFKEKKYVVNAGQTGTFTLTTEGKFQFNSDTGTGKEDDENCWSTSLYRYEIKHKGWHQVTYRIVVTDYNVTKPSDESILSIAIVKNNSTETSEVVITTQVIRENYFNGYVAERTYNFYCSDSDVGKFIYLWGEINNDLTPPSEISYNGTIAVRNVSYLNWVQVQRSFYPADYLPPVTCLDLINAARMFGCEFFTDYNLRDVHIKFIGELLDKGDVVNWNHNTEAGLAVEVEELTGHRLQFSFDSNDQTPQQLNDTEEYDDLGTYTRLVDLPTPTKVNQKATLSTTLEVYVSIMNDSNLLEWQLSGHGFDDYEETNDVVQLTFPAAPALMTTYPFTGNTKIILPVFNQPGNSPAFDLGKNIFGIRFAQYFGIPSGSLQTLASSLNFDYTGTQLGNLALSWQGTYGLYEKYWKRWVEWRRDRARPVTLRRLMTPEELRSIRFWKWYEIDNVLYLLDAVEFDLRDGYQPEAAITAWVV